MKNTVIVIMVVVAAIAGAVFVAPMLKPNNTAFAPDSPSPQVWKRLKGIFKGMGADFTRCILFCNFCGRSCTVSPSSHCPAAIT